MQFNAEGALGLKLVDKSISLAELQEMADNFFGKLVKAVVDTKKKMMVLNVEMHVDAELELLDKGSVQDDLWGINIHPYKTGSDRIEFDSVINIRPRQGNRTRGVDDSIIQKNIISIVNSLVKE